MEVAFWDKKTIGFGKDIYKGIISYAWGKEDKEGNYTTTRKIVYEWWWADHSIWWVLLGKIASYLGFLQIHNEYFNHRWHSIANKRQNALKRIYLSLISNKKW